MKPQPVSQQTVQQTRLHVAPAGPVPPVLPAGPWPVLPPLSPRRRRWRRVGILFHSLWRGLVLAVVAVLALFSFVMGLLGWLIVTHSSDRREAWRWLGLLAVIGAAGYVTWLWQVAPLPIAPFSWLWDHLVLNLSHHHFLGALALAWQLWLGNLFLTPFTTLLFVFLFRRPRLVPRPLFKDITLPEYERAARAEYTTIAQTLATLDHMVLAQEPQAQPGEQVFLPPLPLPLVQAAHREVLGTYEGGELLDWVEAGNFSLSNDHFRGHGVVIGEPSFGKTTTLLRLLAIARRFGRKVIYLDLKGSRTTAAFFLAAMTMLQTRRVKLFPSQALDGWRGDTRTLFNRLMEQIDPRTHPFYRSVGSTVVALAVNAPPRPPRNSYEFLERLDLRWLKRAYVYDAQAQREIRAVAGHLHGLALVFSGFFRGIAGALDGTWSFEDCDACYIGVDGTAHKEEAAALARYIVEDVAHYATSRKNPEDQALFLIDEFGVMRSTNTTDLYERVRESGMSIYAAAQSYESLGQERNNLLAASAVKILHRTGAPEPLIKFAGEREVPQFSRYLGGAGGSEAELLPATNRPDQSDRPDTIMRPQKAYAVTVEEIQQLPLGKIAFLSGGEGALIQVQPLDLPETLVQAARRFLADTPQFTPLPPPRQEPLPPSEAENEQGRKEESGAEQRDPRQAREEGQGRKMSTPETVTKPSPERSPHGGEGPSESTGEVATDDYYS